MTENPAAQPDPNPENITVDESRLVKDRYEKAERLKAQGVNLYVNAYEPTHNAKQIRAAEQELLDSQAEVTIAGRMMSVRSFGKAGFLVLRDESGQMQIYVKKGEIDDASFELYAHGLDTGDIVGARGAMFVTKHGELTVKAKELRLLTKSVRPIPGWKGGFFDLKDVELRYRQRYVDLAANTESRDVFRTRSRIIAYLRRFLDERGYMEVETPMMQAIYGGAAAKPFITKHNALDMNLFLRIAPELFLKRLVVGGYERVYEINRNFRNEGISTRHNPEFTMLELYTAWWDYRKSMDLAEEMFRSCAESVLGRTTVEFNGQTIDLGAPFRRVKVIDIVGRVLTTGALYDFAPQIHSLRWGMTLDEFRRQLSPEQLNQKFVQDALGTSKTADEAMIRIFEALGEPALIQPAFAYDYPKSLCPLAKTAENDPTTAERFEIFCVGMEMGNAYSELNDPAEQLANFEDQLSRKAAGDEEAMSEVDIDYVKALEIGMPPTSGLGVGIDRLVMVLTGSTSIRDVILFPLMKPEKQ